MPYVIKTSIIDHGDGAPNPRHAVTPNVPVTSEICWSDEPRACQRSRPPVPVTYDAFDEAVLGN